ncbi:MAG: 4-hydroxy-3-methylbut-2-enyl diphosphate reductase [Gammaproteobacteria bacterium]|nr:4-hydroxy-3-methylbut-2-enyl diphosphate reductase [Gammaproteobacteria bacterium]
MDIYLANPRGFCAGVDRAIDIVERALDIFDAPVYVRHEVVHNRYVVNNLRQKGAVFVEDLVEVPDNSTVIFSAHGVSQAVRAEANSRDLRIFDATCPLVTKVHLEVARHAKAKNNVILIGHAGHPEVEGTLGQYTSTPDSQIYLIETIEDVARLNIDSTDKLAYVSQTTLSVDDTREIIKSLSQRFPHIEGPRRKDDICYATQNRQDAVRQLSNQVDVFLVIGSTNSSNSNRLRELAEKQGVPAYLIDDANDIEQGWFDSANAVGVTAGASAPEILVEEVMKKLKEEFQATIHNDNGAAETIRFQLPRELR